jgi:hypothetical protein
LLGFLFLLGQFVAVFAEIHEAADRRHGVGRNFHEVHAVLAREVDGVGQRHDAELLPSPDDPDFAGADFAVDPDERRGEELRGVKGRLKRPSPVGAERCGIASKIEIWLIQILPLFKPPPLQANKISWPARTAVVMPEQPAAVLKQIPHDQHVQCQHNGQPILGC